MTDLTFRMDDLSGALTQQLVTRHLHGMRASTPEGKVFALNFEGLRSPDLTFWSGWRGDILVVIGALKQLDERNGELKSMRVADDHLRTGAGRAMLRFLVAEAVARGIADLWLETGNAPEFAAARQLYASEGFEPSDAFGDYEPNGFSVFMRRNLSRRK